MLITRNAAALAKWACISAVACIAAIPATASAKVYSNVGVYVGNHHGGRFSGEGVLHLRYLNGTAGTTNYLDTGTQQYTFTGLDRQGNIGDEVYTGRAMVQAGHGSMKLGASYSLTNRLANDDNAPYVLSDFSWNPAGVPTGFAAIARVEATDTIAVTSAAPIETLQFTYRLTGTISSVTAGEDPYGYYPRDNYLSLYGLVDHRTDRDGSFDELVTGRVKVVNGSAKYLLMVEANAGMFTVFPHLPPWAPFVPDTSGSIDFMNSVDLVSVVGLAADGSTVALTSAMGTSGFNYLAVAVPEPQSYALLLGGLCVVGWLRRRGALVKAR